MTTLRLIARRSTVALAALLVAGLGYAAWRSAAPAATLTHKPPPTMDWSALPAAVITADPGRGELTIELPPVDLPAGAAGHHGVERPASVGEFPVTGAIFGFRTEAVDETGRQLPAAAIHHFNVMEPSERELFLPIARRVLATGQETGVVRLPWLLVGSRFRQGERILANAMLHNPTGEAYRGVRVRMVVNYIPEGRPWPLFAGSGWQLDVAFPVGDKSFDLPPGRSERSYEGSPAVPGDLVVIGGHLHEYGQTIELWDATTGELMWHGEPASSATGKQGAVPIGKLYGLTRRGAHITPAHRYRVRVVYDNPTGQVVSAGGMGVVAGLFIPDRGAVWPSADPSDSLYQQDLRHFLGIGPPLAHMHEHAGH
ncbi:MAG TPA: hypothetical protein VN908_07240 [Gemmatimonadales bacterium]|nr:hypothetical protein [Gemmatimonadales bacterium]